jgi:uncharacterized protein
MKLRVEDITAEAKELAFAESESEINRVLSQGPIREYHVEGPVRVKITYYRAGMDLFFAGDIEAHSGAVCARCAEDFELPNTRQFRFVLSPRNAGFKAERGLRDEDLEFSLYDGAEVDLGPLIREQIILGLPTRPLCTDDCKGLCPRCGANRNRVQCACVEKPQGPRLDVFRSLKVGRD